MSPLGKLRAVWRDRSGVAMIEFAAFLPALVLVLLAGVDLARFIILNQKMDRVAAGMGDLVAQSQSLTTAQLNDIYSATKYIASPFDFSSKGVVIVSSVSLVSGVLRVNWQSRGSGSLSATSKIGTAGGVAKLPTGMTVTGSDTLIAAEVYFDFTSYFGLSVVPNKQIYYASYFRPRLGSLNTLN
jgi:Flp pilus assembly protein TadG